MDDTVSVADVVKCISEFVVIFEPFLLFILSLGVPPSSPPLASPLNGRRAPVDGHQT